MKRDKKPDAKPVKPALFATTTRDVERWLAEAYFTVRTAAPVLAAHVMPFASGITVMCAAADLAHPDKVPGIDLRIAHVKMSRKRAYLWSAALISLAHSRLAMLISKRDPFAKTRLQALRHGRSMASGSISLMGVSGDENGQIQLCPADLKALRTFVEASR